MAAAVDRRLRVCAHPTRVSIYSPGFTSTYASRPSKRIALRGDDTLPDGASQRSVNLLPELAGDVTIDHPTGRVATFDHLIPILSDVERWMSAAEQRPFPRPEPALRLLRTTSASESIQVVTLWQTALAPRSTIWTLSVI